MKTRHSKAVAGGALLAAVALTAAACTGGGGGSSSSSAITTSGAPPTSASASTPTPTPTNGGTLNILTQAEQILHLDPQRNYTGNDLAFAGAYLNRSWTTYKYAEGDGGTVLVPDIATDLGTFTEGGKTWSFTMRDGVKWQDGSDVTCADFKYGVSRTFATDTITDGPTYAIDYLDIAKDSEGASIYKGPYANDAKGQAAFDEAVTCSADNKTITYRLNQPITDFNYAVTLLSFAPVPKALDKGEKYDDTVASNAPYKIESYEKGKALTLVPNDAWSKDSDPVRDRHWDKIVVQFALQPSIIDERLIADSGDDQVSISMDNLQPESLETVFADDAFKDRRIDSTTPYALYVAMNVSSLNCLDIRKAVYYAIDRSALLKNAGGEYAGELSTGVIPPALGAGYVPIDDPDFLPEGNPTKAQTYMDSAKTSCPDLYNQVTTTGIKRDYGDTPVAQKAAAIWQDSLGKVGIKVANNPIEPGKYYGIVLDPAKQGQMSSGGWAPDWLNASTIIPPLFVKGNSFNLSRSGSDPDYPKFAAIVDEAMKATDPATAAAKWAEANAFAIDHVWVIPTMYDRAQYVYGSKIGGAFMWFPYGSYNYGTLYQK